jgi:hypothetical protein
MRTKRRFRYLDEQNLQTVGDVVTAMQTLDRDLNRSDLRRLTAFNTTYRIISQNVRQALRDGRFQHPDFLQRFDTRFAAYYFNALRAYLHGRDAPVVWRKTFDLNRTGQLAPLAAMALGVNAHVNNDIPQVLRDCGARPRHYRDYQLVNDIIRDCIGEIIDNLEPGGRLDPHHRILRPLYVMGMTWFIRRWRANAWKHYRQLTTQRLDRPGLERFASSYVRPLSFLPG